MKNIIEQITKLENENTGYDYNITDLFLNENKANELIEKMGNGEIELINDIECYDEIIYTDKLNWIEFNYDLKRKIDKVNYLTNSDNYQYDKFRNLIVENANTITVHYNDELDLGIVRYDLDKIILFDKEHENQIDEILKNKIEAYVLPNYDKNVIEQIIEKLYWQFILN
jgi:hypothetical protein|nr:MAG TPA: hypothetical protein [Caudoviricetes sp.]